jgi:hypothetical protein
MLLVLSKAELFKMGAPTTEAMVCLSEIHFPNYPSTIRLQYTCFPSMDAHTFLLLLISKH